MAVRRQCNRYKTAPSGRDFQEVLKKAKSFFRNTGRFEIALFGGVYTTTGETDPCYSVPDGTRFFVFNGKRWKETDRSDKRNSFFN